MAVAPVEDQRTAEAAVASEDNLHLRPRLAQPPDQQCEDGTGMVSGIQRGRTQVADKQLVATEHEQRQEDVVVVVAVEVPAERKRPFWRVVSRGGLISYADPVIHRRRISPHVEATSLSLSCLAMAGLD